MHSCVALVHVIFKETVLILQIVWMLRQVGHLNVFIWHLPLGRAAWWIVRIRWRFSKWITWWSLWAVDGAWVVWRRLELLIWWQALLFEALGWDLSYSEVVWVLIINWLVCTWYKIWILVDAVLIKLLDTVSFISSPLWRLWMRMTQFLVHIEAQQWIGERRAVGSCSNIKQARVAYVLLSKFASAQTRWDNILI